MKWKKYVPLSARAKVQQAQVPGGVREMMGRVDGKADELVKSIDEYFLVDNAKIVN